MGGAGDYSRQSRRGPTFPVRDRASLGVDARPGAI